jgi:queuine tRNA-ribosyltransferase
MPRPPRSRPRVRRAGLRCASDHPPLDEPTPRPGTFELLAHAGPARAGRLWTAHGPIDTPCFMPVGTYGAVKGLDARRPREVGSQVILGNSYHLGHRPGRPASPQLGGLHR